MRRFLNAVSILFVALGAALVLLYPVWRFAVGPRLRKVPCDINVTNRLEGELLFFIDPRTHERFSRGGEKRLGVSMEIGDKGNGKLSTSKVAIIGQEAALEGVEGIVRRRTESTYALDRETSRNTEAPASAGDLRGYEERCGYSILFPMRAGRTTYRMWDDETGSAAPAVFVTVKAPIKQPEKGVDSETSATKARLKVETYVYRLESEMRPLLKSPFYGLGDSITGLEAKRLLADPRLDVGDEASVPVKYSKKTCALLAVEPRTGFIVDRHEVREEYFLEIRPDVTRRDPVALATLSYSQENESELVDAAMSYFDRLDPGRLWIPWLDHGVFLWELLVAGAALITGGLLLHYHTSPRRAG